MNNITIYCLSLSENFAFKEGDYFYMNNNKYTFSNKYRIHGMSIEDVKTFQRENNLHADGLVGVQTMEKLLEKGKIRKGTEAYSDWLVNNRVEFNNSRLMYPNYLLYK